MSLTSDKYRKEQLLASMAIPGQPMGKFMWGECGVYITHNGQLCTNMCVYCLRLLSHTCCSLAVTAWPFLTSLVFVVC